MLELSEKIVLVTGGSRGIGRAVVKAMAEADAHTIIHYGQSRQRAEDLAAEIGENRCLTLAADLENPGAAQSLWERAVEWKGRVDVLVNNAGVYLAAPVDATDERWSEVWAPTLQVNLVSAADLCRLAVNHFRPRGGGIIVNVTSRAAHRGDHEDYLHYTASKGGLSSMTRSLARAFAREGVLVYAVAPGWVHTDMTDAFIAEHGKESITSEIPLGEITQPEDIANVVAFLATGKARHAIGSTIDVNGGSYVR